jgi:exopolyphosphatase/guanosine-5'-triphosphate,3'-diphosphate pyrophosphatase
VQGAAVAVGSTSVHFTAARLTSGGLRILADQSVLLELGATVDAHGEIPDSQLGELIAALQGFAAVARELGVLAMTFVATDPLRRAANGHSVAASVEAATARPLHVLSHEEEALLSLYGVLQGHPPAADTLVVDIGGGSSEYVLARTDGPPLAHGLRIGAARLTAAFVLHDPPTAGEIEALRAQAHRRVADAVDMAPARAIFVGGTAENLLRLVSGGRALRTLDRRRLALAFAMLQARAADVLAAESAIRPQRARILPGGAALVEAFLERYRLASASVSRAGIREGTILAVARASSDWRKRLPELVGGG